MNYASIWNSDFAVGFLVGIVFAVALGRMWTARQPQSDFEELKRREKK